MEEGGTAAAANYISFKCCATTPRALVLISELLKSPLGWSQEQAMLFIGYSGYSWAGGGVCEGFSMETASWGTDLAKHRMLPRSLDSSGKVKPEARNNEQQGLLLSCGTQLCSSLKSAKFLSREQWDLPCILR